MQRFHKFLLIFDNRRNVCGPFIVSLKYNVYLSSTDNSGFGSSAIYFKFDKILNKWFWSPYEDRLLDKNIVDNKKWISSDTCIVPDGMYQGEEPVPHNYNIIVFLREKNVPTDFKTNTKVL